MTLSQLCSTDPLLTSGSSPTTKTRSGWQGVHFFKWALPSLFFVFFALFQTDGLIFTSNYCENVQPVYRAGIQTHDLLNTSLPPKPLDQVSGL